MKLPIPFTLQRLASGDQPLRADIILNKILKNDLNCTTEIDQSQEDVTCINFNYQSHNFRAIYYHDDPNMITVHYYTGFTVNQNKHDALVFFCNECNTSRKSMGVRAIYLERPEKNKTELIFIGELALYKYSETSITLTRHLLSTFFGKAFNIIKAIEASGDEENNLNESIARRNNRILTINSAIEQSISRKSNGEQYRFSPSEALTAPVLVKELRNVPVCNPVEITVLTSDGQTFTISDPDECAKYHILNAASLNRELRGNKSAMVRFIYTNEEGLTCEDVFTIYPLHNHKQSLYFRINVLSSTNVSQYNEITVALDFDGPANEAEFKFMQMDANDKLRDGKINELTQEQRAIIEIQGNIRLQTEIFFGTKIFHNECYLQALPYLLRAFDIVRPAVNSDNAPKPLVDKYFELAFMIGACYRQIKRYDIACHYLEIAIENNEIAARMEYINTMIANYDPRALNWTLDEVDDILDNEDFNPPTDSDDYNQYNKFDDDLSYYLAFLIRNITYLYIREQRFNTATKYLKRVAARYLHPNFIKEEMDKISFYKQLAEDNKFNKQGSNDDIDNGINTQQA